MEPISLVLLGRDSGCLTNVSTRSKLTHLKERCRTLRLPLEFLEQAGACLDVLLEQGDCELEERLDLTLSYLLTCAGDCGVEEVFCIELERLGYEI